MGATVAPAPASIQNYKRRSMSDETSGGTDQAATNREQYHLLKEFHRTLRQALTGSEYKVWCAIEDWSESKGECWHSQSTIAQACDISVRAVNSAVKRLEELTLIETKERTGQSSYYTPVRPTYAIIAHLRENLRKFCRGTHANFADPPTQILQTNGSNKNVTKDNDINPATDVAGTSVTILPKPEIPKNKVSQPPSSRQVEVKTAASNQGERPRAEGKNAPPTPTQLPEQPIPKTKKVAEWKSDPRILTWQKYAKLKGYRGKYGYFPETAQAKLILDKVPIEFVERWDRLIQLWLQKRFFIGNVFDLVDVFVNGWKPVGKVQR